MAPIRRYLRISKYSVLECRIYLEDPGLANVWLLNPRDPVLPRVFESVRPYVLPKLREENERAKGKGKKANRGIKDVVVHDDFEVSIFLTDVSTRHSLLTKQKFFGESGWATLASSSRLASGTSDSPANIDPDTDSPTIIREESVELDTLKDIASASNPQVFETVDSGVEAVPRSQSEQSSAQRKGKRDSKLPEPTDVVAESSSSSDARPPQIPNRKRRRSNAASSVATKTTGDVTDDKKLALHTSYDGFSIYGRILCLVVKRKSSIRARGGSTVASSGGTMEDWIASTQIQREADVS
ncbi:hypothetical protein GP486_000568 [Trichoglossum hirsutum]|uniref:Uncharacterized protein n=1 Tax=Trichoglossum hirsutum TaxID=265104 RepID=A0A9P8LIC3_9PEZI|nr:hypothetical protein GP486_000568 [Trichoglossum hirsutum]